MLITIAALIATAAIWIRGRRDFDRAQVVREQLAR